MYRSVVYIIVIVAVMLIDSLQVFPQPPDTLWTYTYASSADDEAYTIAPTADGGFIVGGKGKAPDSTNGALLIRLDSNGHEVWIRRYPQFTNEIRSAIAMEDGSFAMTGECSLFDISVVRTDSTGAVQWSRCIPTSLYGEQGWSITRTADGGIAVLGVSYAVAHFDIFLVRLASNGDSLWTQTFASPASYKEGAVINTSDGGFLVGTSSFGQANAIKTDSIGTVQWNTLFGISTEEECIQGINEANNGDYLVAGIQSRPTGLFTYNPYAARLTSLGDTLWTKVYPDLGPAWFYAVSELTNGNILFGGTNGYSYMLVESDHEGNIIWTTYYDTPLREHHCFAMCLAEYNGVAMAGYKAALASNSQDIWVIRAGSDLEAEERFTALQSSFNLLPNYPNPFNSTTTISFTLARPGEVKLTVYDLQGRKVGYQPESRLHYSTGEHHLKFDASGLSSGIYFVQMKDEQFIQTRKIILLK